MLPERTTQKFSGAHESQNGFSLVTVVLALSVVSMLAVILSKSSTKILKASHAISDRSQGADVVELIKGRFVSQFNQNITANCFPGGMQAAFSTLNLTGTAVLSSSAASFSNPMPPLTGNLPAALERCRRMSNQNQIITTNRFHICLGVSRDPSAPIGSVLAANYGLVEISGRMIDLRTGNEISCSSYKADRTNGYYAGLEIFYQMFWSSGTGKNQSYQQTNGAFYGTSTL